MARWAGWGAGPAGAGAAGGPSRGFLAIALAACVVIAIVQLVQHRWIGGAAAGAGAAYFVARLAGFGRADDRDGEGDR